MKKIIIAVIMVLLIVPVVAQLAEAEALAHVGHAHEPYGAEICVACAVTQAAGHTFKPFGDAAGEVLFALVILFCVVILISSSTHLITPIKLKIRMNH